MEEGLLPHERSLRSEHRDREIEEERRLLFVGMTRAKEKLHLTQAARRSIHGRDVLTIPSLFAQEIECDRVSVDDGPALLPEWQRTELVDRLAKRREESEGDPLSFGGKPLLMTGAALLDGSQQTVTLPIGFEQGQQVRHPRYGRGTVMATDGHGGRRTVTVRFDDADADQTFNVAKCPLKPIGK